MTTILWVSGALLIGILIGWVAKGIVEIRKRTL